MELLRRHRFAAGLILILVVALLGWQLQRDDSSLPIPTAPEVAPPSSLSGESPSPVPSANIPASADESIDTSVGALRGRAFDAITNEPVRTFEIMWREPIGEPRQQFDSRRQTFRTTDGRFEYPNVPPGKWSIIVTARGYQRFELPELRVASEAVQEVQLPLQKGYTLHGRVYDQATGAGVAASIDVLDPLTQVAFRGRGTAKPSAEDGTFVIEDLPPGRAALAVEAKNYTSRTVFVEIGANTPSQEIGMSAGATIAGRFTTAAASPIAAGSVTLYRAEGVLVGNTNTDAAGMFGFRDLEAGNYQLVGRHGSAIVTHELTLSGGTANVQLTLEAGRTIRGTVTGLRPELFKAVNISAHRDSRALWTQNAVNDHGEFELNDVTPGSIRIVADVNRTREISKVIEMPADTDITITLDFPPGAALSGRVTRNGKPLPDLPIAVQPQSPRSSTSWDHNKTSSTGTYSVQDLEPGEYVVRVGTFISKPVQVQGNVVFDIDMPGGDLSGRVLDESNGVPLANASVDLHFGEAASSSRINRLTDHLGQFTIEGVVPTEYVLTVYRPGYRLYRERISFHAQTAAQAIRLRQDRGVEIRGRDAATGRPLREILVFERLAGHGGLMIALPLDESGIGYLPSGLAGSKLQLIAPSVGHVDIPSWDGDALDLRFGFADSSRN
jgi:protocatechuate 3,4-dioxygenase beta subunit